MFLLVNRNGTKTEKYELRELFWLMFLLFFNFKIPFWDLSFLQCLDKGSAFFYICSLWDNPKALRLVLLHLSKLAYIYAYIYTYIQTHTQIILHS